ncbi:MAG: sigma-54 dependent transcriptional regulator [Bacteroidota bacterium]|nr:sigma-54 dependent transcriptional regulator [Bacteroidota bacterium]MDP4213366.1 sigma-54 dependent transcriptional regulator [Bacteroidota bacterium]MDP4251527.1 sigma-54 dependent transcriptional regulator [Bacteroidota bacterium]
MKRILIVDDDRDMCNLLERYLQRKGFDTEAVYTGNRGMSLFREKRFDIVLCDFRLGDMEGREVLTEMKNFNAAIPVIIITGYSDIKIAIDVIKAGAFDYITKPLIPDEVLTVINKAIHGNPNGTNSNLQSQQAKSKLKSADPGEARFLVGKSPLTIELYRQVDLVSPTNYSVILYGESGTGKEVIARTIHSKSQRKDKPFIALDCGTLSKELAGSELFGHVKGAFTGALNEKEGHFELANGGTLFLDEVANLSYEIQAALLRVIQERKFKQVGGNKEMGVDVRIIVASNEDLQDAYRQGKFREDLFHRFNEFSIIMPPLRNRKEDIPLFARFFLDNANEELNKKVEGFEDEVIQMFLNYPWPGNLRELRNVVRRSALLSPSGVIGVRALPAEIAGLQWENIPKDPAKSVQRPEPENQDLDLKNAAAHAEYNTIMNVLKKVNFNKSKAAEILKIDRKTLYNKIKLYESVMGRNK